MVNFCDLQIGNTKVTTWITWFRGSPVSTRFTETAFCWKLLQVQFTVDGRAPPGNHVKPDLILITYHYLKPKCSLATLGIGNRNNQVLVSTAVDSLYNLTQGRWVGNETWLHFGDFVMHFFTHSIIFSQTLNILLTGRWYFCTSKTGISPLRSYDLAISLSSMW